MDNVMGSAAEAEIGAAYINGREAIPIQTTLQELNHPQPSTKMQVENTTHPLLRYTPNFSPYKGKISPFTF